MSTASNFSTTTGQYTATCPGTAKGHGSATGHDTVPPKLVRFVDLPTEAGSKTDWLWSGYLAPGNVTLLTSQWKVGKTTLLAMLMARMQTGGSLAGQDVAIGRALVISEESPRQWGIRVERVGIGTNVVGFCRPFAGQPTHEEWKGLVERLEELWLEETLHLVVVDSLGFFAPCGAENQKDAILAMLRPLERLTSAGVAVLILHHPRKGANRVGQAARGAGALSAYCDILIEMDGIAHAGATDRRRRLLAWSRHEETPRDVVIELSPDGRDYPVCLQAPDDESEHGLQVAIEVLRRVQQPLTRRQVLLHWPEKHRPNPGTLWRWLDRGVNRGLVTCKHVDGKATPLIYSLPGVDARWKPEMADFVGDGMGMHALNEYVRLSLAENAGLPSLFSALSGRKP